MAHIEAKHHPGLGKSTTAVPGNKLTRQSLGSSSKYQRRGRVVHRTAAGRRRRALQRLETKKIDKSKFKEVQHAIERKEGYSAGRAAAIAASAGRKSSAKKRWLAGQPLAAAVPRAEFISQSTPMLESCVMKAERFRRVVADGKASQPRQRAAIAG